MLEVYRAAADLQRRCEERGWRFCLIGGMPFEESAVARATPYEFAPGVFLLTASAEDLIVMKAFAARPKDWVDVEGIVIRQGERLDWDYIEHHLRPLVDLKEEPEILGHLARIRADAGLGNRA